MARSALRSVGDAIDATRSFLAPPSLRRIASLAILALFLGIPGTPLPANPQFADPYFWRTWEPPSAPDAETNGAVEPSSLEVASPGTWPPWLLAGVGIAIAVVLAYLFVGTLMRFVLVEAIRSREVRLRRDGVRHWRGALGVLGLRLLLWGLALPVLAVAAAAGLGVGPIAPDGVGLGLLGALATAALAIAWLIELVTLQFVVPTMIADGRGVLAGWRRFLPTLRAEAIEYLLYGVVRMLLGVAVGLAAALGVAIVLALAGVVLGTLGAIVVVLAGGLGSLGPVSLAVLGVLGTLFVLIAIVTVAVVAVPFQLYLWIYALLVLGDTDPTLDLIPELRASVRQDGSPVDSEDAPVV